MKKLMLNQRTPSAELFTELILEVFRFNGKLLASGDQLTRQLGLTSALWQVLGAITEKALTVSQIARRMGLTRQSVSRSVHTLADKGFVTFDENPDHQRAKLVSPTDKGYEAIFQLKEIQTIWSNKISKGMNFQQLRTTVQTIRNLNEII